MSGCFVKCARMNERGIFHKLKHVFLFIFYKNNSLPDYRRFTQLTKFNTVCIILKHALIVDPVLEREYSICMARNVKLVCLVK